MANPTPNEIPSVEYLNEVFIDDGKKLIWRNKRGSRGKAGSPAGCKSKGYISVKLNGIMYRAHRILWVMRHGPIPNGLEIDHKNRIRGDNRDVNLRLVTSSENSLNDSRYQPLE